MHDVAMVGSSSHERRDHDFYATPAWCTEALFTYWLFGRFGKVWEPACGNGAMAKVLEQKQDTYCSDLIDRDYGACGVDFLKQEAMLGGTKSIITNPPFGKEAEKFLRHALVLTEGAGYVAFLLRNEFCSAKGRTDLFGKNSRFAAKIVLTKRPMWIEGTKGSPRHNYAWYIFGPDLNIGPASVYYHHPDDWKLINDFRFGNPDSNAR